MSDKLQQDAKIDMYNGTHVEGKQRRWTMLDAMTIIAGRAHNSSDIARASAVTDISEEEISRHINKHRAIWYD